MKLRMELTTFTSLRTTASVLAVVTALSLAYLINRHNFITDENIDTYRCLQKQFVPTILSTDPLLIHIDEFVTPFEAEYLISLAKFEPSTIGLSDKITNTTTRRSQSAVLPDVLEANVSDPVVECILQRASAFQGHVPLSHTEPLQLVKYQAGEYYRAHYDAWTTNKPDTQGNRETSFFVTLRSVGLLNSTRQDGEAVATTGARSSAGTSFPRLRRRFEDARLCKAIECGGEEEGIVAKPVALSALFWVNLMENGEVHSGSLHQGLELPEGEVEKMGMNIWTWNRPYLGQDM